jgi:hypothetical protein
MDPLLRTLRRSLFRDHKATFLEGFNEKLSFSSVLHAELKAIKHSLELASNEGWCNL